MRPSMYWNPPPHRKRGPTPLLLANPSLIPRPCSTHLPAFAVLREIAGFGIVRTTRGNHSRCHAPSSGRAGMCCENRGGVLMESGDGARVKTAIPRSGLITVRRRGGVDVDFNVTVEMKIIQFPENIDKLTGFFDKYLKTKLKDEKSHIIIFQLVMSLY